LNSKKQSLRLRLELQPNKNPYFIGVLAGSGATFAGVLVARQNVYALGDKPSDNLCSSVA